MGSGMNFRCKSCGYKYSAWYGIGMMFPTVYSKVLKKVKNGKYGKELREKALNTPFVAVDAEKHVYKCSKCGAWKCEEGLALYEPNDIEKFKAIRIGDKTVGELGEGPCVFGPYFDDYHIVKQYVHKCDKCGSSMQKASEEEIENLPCPKCGGEPEEDFSGIILWD